MPTDPLAAHARSIRHTPATQPLPGRTDTVPNSGGGYAFQLDDWQRLHRFLILGTDGGTFYAGEQTLTAENADVAFRCLKEDGVRVVDHVRNLSLAGDAPKQDPLLFTLALACASPDAATQDAAFASVGAICRTATMLFKWNGYLEQLRGRGKRFNRAVQHWYNGDVADVAFQAIKYRQREGWTHRDLLRLAKPKPATPSHDALFGWIAGTKPAPEGSIVEAFEEIQRDDTTSARAVELITANRLPWEAIPTRLHDDADVWRALLLHMGATAILRQLPRLARLGIIGAFGPVPPPIARLADVEVLRRARIHPVAVLNALVGYSSGQSQSGGSHVVSPQVVGVLDEAFHASFGTIIPAGKRTLIALDVSASMTYEKLRRLPALTPRDATAAMAMATVRTEPECLVVGFSTSLTQLNIGRDTLLLDAVRAVSGLPFAGTDCSLPMRWARSAGIGDVETFITFTDNETNAGVWPSQALREYRDWSGSPARSAVCAMTSTGFTIADPEDPGMFDLVGFDAACPTLLGSFSRGDL